MNEEERLMAARARVTDAWNNLISLLERTERAWSGTTYVWRHRTNLAGAWGAWPLDVPSQLAKHAKAGEAVPRARLEALLTCMLPDGLLYRELHEAWQTLADAEDQLEGLQDEIFARSGEQEQVPA